MIRDFNNNLIKWFATSSPLLHLFVWLPLISHKQTNKSCFRSSTSSITQLLATTLCQLLMQDITQASTVTSMNTLQLTLRLLPTQS